ncbi:LppA family lipoprotein [Rhodococcoides kyotonense]|uniref:Lipoprotein n=1 Tax=Rhodococcoides kyotonense TaxID=398843 RepID=A0A239LGH1_9NOCA|nr:LppA family lipoprotein [Rhodococcus kyotonensis]SNT29032.1 Lipoprotein [Rhodococcus kyotonensis]
MIRSAKIFGAVVCTVALMAGCARESEGPTVNAQQIAEIKDALRAKGPVEDELRRLDPVVLEMAEAVSAVVGGLTWTRITEGRRLPCEAVPGDPGSASAWTVDTVAFDGPIPDALWTDAVARVQGIAVRVGSSELVVRVDKPGHHDVQFVASDKTQFGLASREAAAIFAQTGCFLNLSDQGSGA